MAHNADAVTFRDQEPHSPQNLPADVNAGQVSSTLQFHSITHQLSMQRSVSGEALLVDGLSPFAV
jgi:hypothetical protein